MVEKELSWDKLDKCYRDAMGEAYFFMAPVSGVSRVKSAGGQILYYYRLRWLTSLDAIVGDHPELPGIESTPDERLARLNEEQVAKLTKVMLAAMLKAIHDDPSLGVLFRDPA